MLPNFYEQGLKVQRSLPRNFEEKDLHLFAHELEVLIPAQAFAHNNNLIIDYNGNCLDLFSPDASGQLSTNKETKRRNRFFIFKDFCKAYLKRKIIYIDNASWVCDEWSQNYFHWFLDTLPKLIIIEMNFPQFSILIPKHLYEKEFIQQSLLYFKLQIVVLENFNLVKAKKYIHLPDLSVSGNYIPDLVSSLRAKFLVNDKKTLRKVFVIREEYLNRAIINISEVKDVLKKYSFEIITLNGERLLDQIKIFSETAIFITVHGAALTNMLFMPRDGAVMELRRNDDALNNCYFSLASVLKISYYYQLCEVDNYRKSTQENSFKVCTISLEKNILQIFGDLGISYDHIL